MNETVIRTRISAAVSLLILGALWLVIGIPLSRMLSGYWVLIPIVFFMLSLFTMNAAFGMLLLRNRLAIRVSESGITVPCTRNTRSRELTQHIPRQSILRIERHLSLKGRGIDVVTKDGNRHYLEIRNYCRIRKFLGIARTYGLPIAQPDNRAYR